MKKFKFKIQGNPYDVIVKDVEDNIVLIEVNGTSYEVEIEKQLQTSKTPTLVRKPVKTAAGEGQIAKSAGLLQVRAPLPGNILQVTKKPGDAVKKGDLVLIYEAMKMENQVLAERDGLIASIKVNPGDSVLQGDVIFEIQ